MILSLLDVTQTVPKLPLAEESLHWMPFVKKIISRNFHLTLLPFTTTMELLKKICTTSWSLKTWPYYSGTPQYYAQLIIQ